jgi:hypothetical protein
MLLSQTANSLSMFEPASAAGCHNHAVHFHSLQEASKLIKEQLRRDEATHELSDQLVDYS